MAGCPQPAGEAEGREGDPKSLEPPALARVALCHHPRSALVLLHLWAVLT